MTYSDRYHRQALLPQIGCLGQEKLGSARVLLIGCGALGCSVAQQLVRGGVGYLRLVDRDLVDLTNLHRQVLFSEADAREQVPKALAAANALRLANSQVTIDPLVADIHSANIAEIVGKARPHVIVDGTDNAHVRYLINDLAVREGIAWIYGACVGVEGRVMAIAPRKTACLRCLFPEPPAPGELATCDTAGVLPAAAAVTGALEAAQAMRLLLEGSSAAGRMLALDAWTMRFRGIDASARRDDCVCCAKGEYEFLNRPARLDATALCGRDVVQVRPAVAAEIDLHAIATRMGASGEVREHEAFVRFVPGDQKSLVLSVFPDGRVLVKGTGDVSLARTLVARYVGH